MCGLAGLLVSRPQGGVETRARAMEIATEMAASIAHRGPDSCGVWATETAGGGVVAMAHQRLSILDLSPAADQPMTCDADRVALAYNGETYNFRELATDLPDRVNTSSDTAVLLHLLGRGDIADSLQRVDGMFALSYWNAARDRLVLARDRFGEKPLYLGVPAPGVVVWGSELRAVVVALRRLGYPVAEDRASVDEFYALGFVAAPRSILQGVVKVLPGTYLDIPASDMPTSPSQAIDERHRYWSPGHEAAEARATPFDGTFDDAVAHLGVLLQRTAASRTVSDVPVGCLLSGGVDSTALAAALTDGGQQVDTFTVRSRHAEYDEGDAAARTAAMLGTRHHEILLESDDVQRLLPGLPHVYDEPFADMSQLAAVVVARHVSSHVKVVLSGDGGDELFAGYNRHVWLPAVMDRIDRLPRAATGVVGRLAGLRPQRTEALARALAPVTPRRLGTRAVADKLGKLTAVMGARDDEEAYLSLLGLTGAWGRSPRIPLTAAGDMSSMRSVQLADTEVWLPDDILVKMDRACMSASLENRAPFLSPSLYRFAWSLPDHHLVRRLEGKRVLRAYVRARVGDDVAAAPKTGFDVPMEHWLRTSLSGWAGDIIDGATFDGLPVDAGTVRASWTMHQQGIANRQHDLWRFLVHQTWRDAVLN